MEKARSASFVRGSASGEGASAVGGGVKTLE